MKKIFKVLLVAILLIATKVKADYSSLMLDPEYTSVFKNDEFKVKLGYDYAWDEVHTYKEKNEYGYMMYTVYFVYNPKVFSVNTDSIKVNSRFNTEFMEVVVDEIDEDKTMVSFANLYIKKYGDYKTEELYEGLIDDEIITNIKVKVLPSATVGTYYFISSYMDPERDNEDDEEQYYNYEKYSLSVLPINVIDGSAKNNRITLNNSSLNIEDKKTDYVFKVNVDDIVNKKIVDEDIINIICSKRCKAYNVGNNVYAIDESDMGEDYNISLVIDGKKTTYKVNDESNLIHVPFDWYVNSKEHTSPMIVVIDNNEDYSAISDEVRKINDAKFNQYMSYESCHFNELTDTDKEIINKILDKDITFDEYKGPYFYIVRNGEVQYKQVGYISDNKVEPEKTNNKTLYLLIGGILVVWFIILAVIILINKGKKNEQ